MLTRSSGGGRRRRGLLVPVVAVVAAAAVLLAAGAGIHLFSFHLPGWLHGGRSDPAPGSYRWTTQSCR